MLKKYYKKIFISILLLFCAQLSSHSSLLWDINEGIDKYRKNDFEASKNYFKDYVLSNPNDKDGYFWLGKNYIELNDLKMAQQSLNKAYELAIQNYNLEKIELNIEYNDTLQDYFDMASFYFENNNIDEAALYADMMLKISPNSASAYFIKARIAQMNQNEAQAKEYLNKAIIFNNSLLSTNLAKKLNITSIPEQNNEMYGVFALESYFSSDLDGAVKYLKKYLSLDNSDYETANLLVDSYIKKNDLVNAQNTLDEIMKNNKNDISSFLNQAKIYALQNNPSQSLSALLSAYKINPNHQEVLIELGNYYLKNKDYLSAKRYFENAITINDGLYEGYFGLCYCLIELEQDDLAQKYIKKMKELNENSSEIPYLSGLIAFKDAKYLDAKGYFDEAKKISPHKIYKKLSADTNYILKNYDLALRDYVDVSNDFDVNYEIMKIYLKSNDLKNATKYLLKLDKNSLIYKYNLYIINNLSSNEAQTLNIAREIKKFKPVTIKDYLDLSEVLYDQSDSKSAQAVLDKGLKKFRSSNALYNQKLKFAYWDDNQKELNKILDEKKNSQGG